MNDLDRLQIRRLAYEAAAVDVPVSPRYPAPVDVCRAAARRRWRLVVLWVGAVVSAFEVGLLLGGGVG